MAGMRERKGERESYIQTHKTHTERERGRERQRERQTDKQRERERERERAVKEECPSPCC